MEVEEDAEEGRKDGSAGKGRDCRGKGGKPGAVPSSAKIKTKKKKKITVLSNVASAKQKKKKCKRGGCLRRRLRNLYIHFIPFCSVRETK